MNTTSFIEDHIAQLPALKLLMNIVFVWSNSAYFSATQTVMVNITIAFQ